MTRFIVVTNEQVEHERRCRIRLALSAFNYYFTDHNEIMTDATFDRIQSHIDVSIDTGHSILDSFFRKKWASNTGQWIYWHPELDKVEKLYYYLKKIGVYDE